MRAPITRTSREGYSGSARPGSWKRAVRPRGTRSLGFVLDGQIALHMAGHQPNVACPVELVRLRRPWAEDRCHRCAWLSGQAYAAMLSGGCMHARAEPACAARRLMVGRFPAVVRFHCSARVRFGPLLV